MLKNLVAFGYRTKTGKGTAAKYLCDKYGFVQIDIGDEIRAQCAACYHLPLEAFNDEHKEDFNTRWGMSHRDILKKHSVAMTELWGLGYWLRFLDERIDIAKQAALDKNEDIKIVVSDLRRPHEVDHIFQRGGMAIRLDGPPRGAFENRGHLTDYALDSYDRWTDTINNNGTKEELFAMLDARAKQFKWA